MAFDLAIRGIVGECRVAIAIRLRDQLLLRVGSADAGLAARQGGRHGAGGKIVAVEGGVAIGIDYGRQVIMAVVGVAGGVPIGIHRSLEQAAAGVGVAGRGAIGVRGGEQQAGRGVVIAR